MSALVFDIKTDKLMKLSDILKVLEKAGVVLSRATMARWIKTGYFPRCDFHIGGSGRWAESTFKRWLEQCVKDASK